MHFRLAEKEGIWYVSGALQQGDKTMMLSKVAKAAFMLAAVMLLASGVWADEVPEPIGDMGEGLPIAVKAMLCLLPTVGAWCLYHVMRRRA